MLDQWRLILRGLAVAAVVWAGVLCIAQPIANYHVPTYMPPVLRATCLSPFNRLTGEQEFKVPRFVKQPPYSMPEVRARACSSATNKREHTVDALGVGAVILIGLSFLPRRRPVVTVSVNPSML